MRFASFSILDSVLETFNKYINIDISLVNLWLTLWLTCLTAFSAILKNSIF